MCEISSKSRIQILSALGMQLSCATDFVANSVTAEHKALWAKRAEDIETAMREFSAAVYGVKIQRVIS